MADDVSAKIDPAKLEYTVIRELYEEEEFEVQLDRALDNKIQTIVIEPRNLGDITSRWISVGNCLHKTTVLAGLGCTVFHVISSRSIVVIPLSLMSVTCAAVYAISWSTDPCCKYQVETKTHNLQHLSLTSLTSSSVVVLTRKDDTRRKFLHNTIAVMAGLIGAWKIYSLMYGN